MALPIVFNIQKFSIHDGDGIRTTVFFKGCPLSCIWCHNPESQNYQKEFMFNSEKCTGCNTCLTICHNQAIHSKGNLVYTDEISCDLCEICLDYCINNAREIVGKTYTMKQLIKEIEKDRMFYEESFGGVTLSGGEVMCQNMDYIEELVKKLKEKGYDITIDTCGYAPYENFERILPYVDTFLYDIKLMNHEKHKKYTGQGNNLILDNLKKISNQGAKIYIRLPIIENINNDDNNIDEIITFLQQGIQVDKIFLLPYHNTGKSKYEKLGRLYPKEQLKTPSQENLEQIMEKFKNNGFVNIKIGG